ncbi:transcriptional regulator [Plantactinospora sp. BC1]|uniref:AfsR/SARP family transcriptional regulator n=1 Tax=Plantactinospora sp. BC1 TaxID=2108470 RepID=UPI000D170FBA|nr:BTAD domain-containing putative transcriptional regulator [Plantactinospora sp. BC1]AVT28370.1 transcriptional regulator [Plantactinospora sp. BC1]
MLEVRLLGPLEIIADDVPLPPGPPKQQVVLSMLASQPGRRVGMPEMVDELWPSGPPASAVANLRGYAANLRRLLDGVAAGRGVLVRRGDGYELGLRPEDVDVFGFVAELREASVALAAGDLAAAERSLGRAEGRWRGPMLAGLPLGPALSARAEAMRELRLGMVEQWAELCLATGRAGAAVMMLRDHLSAHPLREGGHGLLIRALYQEGDVPGALAAFGVARSALVEQLGIEPGAELQRLHQAVLNRDPVLDGAGSGPRPRDRSTPRDDTESPSPKSAAPESAGAVPTRWLPRAPADFTGRDELVDRLSTAIRRVDPGSSAVLVIDGMAGIGKTAVAVHLAGRFARSYPDGQLFVDLGGHGTDGQVSAAAALITLLRQLGVPASRIPAEFDHRVALWRSELACRRVVLVLDNAGSSEQVTPLLPSAPGSLTLVTSRRRLVVSSSVPPLTLPLLDRAEAVDLLARLVGRERVDAEPEAVAAVVGRCGYLPLAIRLAGARLAHRPEWRVADLAERLAGARPVLDELSAEDSTVANAFGLSYEPLPEPARRMFRLLGLFPGEHFGVGVAAALADVSLMRAETLMAELVDRHLVQEPAAGRFRLHDLVRDYARELTAGRDEPADLSAAFARLFDYYVHACLAASRAMEPVPIPAKVSPGGPLRPDLLSALPTDLEWLEAERQNLRALARLGAERCPQWTWQFAASTWRFYMMRGYYDDILHTYEYGLWAARQCGDESGVAAMCNYRAYAYMRSGNLQLAVRDLETAIEVREKIGDRAGASGSRANLGTVYWYLGRMDDLIDLHRDLLADRTSWGEHVLTVLPNIGLALMFLGRYQEALEIHRRHLHLARVVGSPFHLARALTDLGAVRSRLGQFELAVRFLRTSMRLQDRTGNRYGEAFALNELGTALRGLRRFDEAREYHQRALASAEQIGERQGEAAALNGIGLTLAAQGRHDEAVGFHHHALRVATRISHPYEQGRALAGIAGLLERDDRAEACRYWKRAVAIFDRLRAPERVEAERRLAALTSHADPDSHRRERGVCVSGAVPG